MKKSCAFIGGSNIKMSDELDRQTRNAIEKCIADGYSDYYFGCYGNWTILCGSILRDLKRKMADVYSYCFIPDLPFSNDYLEELTGLVFFDEVKVLPNKNIINTQLYIINSSERILVLNADKSVNRELLLAAKSGTKELIII